MTREKPWIWRTSGPLLSSWAWRWSYTDGTADYARTRIGAHVAAWRAVNLEVLR